MLLRELYWFSKSSSVFSLPFLRKFRNIIARKHLNIESIKVGDRVFIRASHNVESSYFKADKGLMVASDCSIDFTGGLKLGKNVTFSEGVKVLTHDHELNGAIDWRHNPISFF